MPPFDAVYSELVLEPQDMAFVHEQRFVLLVGVTITLTVPFILSLSTASVTKWPGGCRVSV